MNRRDLLKGGIVAGAALALPARALAESLGTPSAGFALPNSIPAQATSNTGYERRVLAVAQRECERAGRSLWRTDLVGIADFGRPSTLPRFHFVNLESGNVRSYLVSHGRGSDYEHDGWLKRFSNVPGSNATSRGGYLTCEWYKGKYGTSIRLEGLDHDNSNALSRAIVIHPASYAEPSMITRFGKLGRSEGCFAMSPEDFPDALLQLSGGRLLFADRIGDA